MTTKALRISTLAMVVILAGILVWAIIAENYIVPMVAVVLAVGLNYLLRRRTRQVTQDERMTLLFEKAAGATVKICVPLMALVGLFLLVLQERLSDELVSAAYGLAYVACALTLVHLAFYSYYSRKH